MPYFTPFGATFNRGAFRPAHPGFQVAGVWVRPHPDAARQWVGSIGQSDPIKVAVRRAESDCRRLGAETAPA